ncbi:MAG: thioredoxin family protein [Zymomonas mobilis]|uniref:Thiol-disulfide isomerase/thioredoxin n=1 Tax=Zymomonas mobilis TaxID=542 RepID=A0A542VYZ6_ZYMMB|nr:thioredoxin family protein [Zymomonas mobilis]TQL16529.1 thiol-disulfide isomerase/thioredoxin [Zymomonas mobilis]
MSRLLTASLFMLLAISPANALPAPKITITNFDQLAHPLPMPYNEQLNAEKAVAAARTKAKKMHKLLLIDLGGNWCPDCRILGGMFDQPDLKRFMDKYYEIVTIDVGRFDKNLSIPAHYGLTDRLKGAPTLLVVDPRTDKLLNGGHVTALADARSMTPQAIADWLAQWVR